MLSPMGAPSAENVRTVGKSGARISNWRPAANLHLSLNNSPYALVSRKPFRSAKTLVLSKNTADSLPPEWNFPISGPVKSTPTDEFRALIAMVDCVNPPTNSGNRKAGRPGPWTRAVLYMASSLIAPNTWIWKSPLVQLRGDPALPPVFAAADEAVAEF